MLERRRHSLTTYYLIKMRGSYIRAQADLDEDPNHTVFSARAKELWERIKVLLILFPLLDAIIIFLVRPKISHSIHTHVHIGSPTYVVVCVCVFVPSACVCFRHLFRTLASAYVFPVIFTLRFILTLFNAYVCFLFSFFFIPLLWGFRHRQQGNVYASNSAKWRRHNDGVYIYFTLRQYFSLSPKKNIHCLL